MTLSEMIVPGGMFAAARFTVTGLVVFTGSVTSGDVNDPPGLAGAVMPPTEVIDNVGPFASVTDVGGPVVTAPACVPGAAMETVLVNASIRMRPELPAPPLELPPACWPAFTSIVPLPTT